jgi:hypothetical protein
MDKLHFDRTTIQLFEQGTTSEFLEVGDLSCREIKPVSRVSRLHGRLCDRRFRDRRSQPRTSVTVPAAISSSQRRPRANLLARQHVATPL